MRKLIIKLPDDVAATFEVQPVIVMFPTSREGYFRFLDAAENMHVGLAAGSQVIAKLQGLQGLTPEAAEGLQVLSDIVRHLVEFEAQMQAFFAPSVAISHHGGKGERLQ
jgi:hypothetical protein